MIVNKNNYTNQDIEMDEPNEMSNPYIMNVETHGINLEKKDHNTNNKEDENSDDIKDLILYIIMDKSNPSILQYYRECGINVSRIFTNINDAKDTLLMQVNPVKILIIDTGTGRFSAMGSRKEIIDLMGICDEDARISVYYTDTVIKSEVEYSDSFEERSIHWHRFKSNADVIAHLLINNNKERYVYDNDDKDKVVNMSEDILDFKGLSFKEHEQINIGEPSITLNDIIVNMINSECTDNEIESFKIVKI